MKVESLIVGPIQVNCYFVTCTTSNKCFVIDPGDEVEEILAVIHKNQYTVEKILLTHGHFDHVGAAAELRELTGAPIYIHQNEREILRHVDLQTNLFGFSSITHFEPDFYFTQNENFLECGCICMTVLETPGHSPGGVSYYCNGHVFVGDALFAGSIGRTDLFEGNLKQLIHSIRTQLLTLPEDTIVYPGHGPTTFIEREMLTNPYLQ